MANASCGSKQHLLAAGERVPWPSRCWHLLAPTNVTTEQAAMMPADAKGVADILRTMNKSTGARNTTVVFYPRVYRGVIYISAGKAANEDT